MHQLKQSAPFLLCAVVIMAFMASTRAVLATEREISDQRYQIQEESMQTILGQLEEQQEINNLLLRTISELQEEVDGLYRPRDIPLDPELQAYTYYAALDAGIDPNIVFEIMRRESGYQVDATGYNRNGTTDTGLMQINSCNWSWLAHEGINVHDPYGNIDAGIYILSMFTDKYPVEQAIAAYAVGESGMERGGGTWYARSILDAI